MKKKFFAICGLAALLGMVSVVGVFGQNSGAPAPIRANRSYTARTMKMKRERHPALRVALRALLRAHAILNRAPHDFKGHRAAAEKLVAEAMRQMREAIAVDRK